MANYGAKILNVATRALSVQQAIIANTSNNIANVNTPGYSRRVVNLQTADGARNAGAGIDVGNGVDIASVQRMADEYLNTALRTGTANQASSQVQNEFLARIDKLFSLDGTTSTISNSINAFFGSVNDLTADPSNINLRKIVIERAQNVVTSISSTYNSLASLQTEADSRLATEVASINGLTAQIAQLNQDVSTVERAGNVTASDARDQRDRLLEELAKKMSFQTVEQSDGSLNIYLANGFSLVAGAKSYDLSVTSTPSFATGPLPPSLSGQVLSYITYDYSGGAGTGDFDLTTVLQNGEGSVGGLLKLRGYNDPSNTSAFDADGSIVEIASRVEALTRDLLTRFNTTYLGPDEDSGTAGFQPSAMDLNGSTPPVYGFFDFAFSGTKDADSNGLPDDLTALGIDNFSSILQLRSTDPRTIAAARDQNATNGALTLVPGDGSNAAALGALQNTNATFSAGSFSITSTYDGAYNELVTHVSSAKSAMSNRASLDRATLSTVQSQRDEVSAVSLDEEFTGLIKFQKAYQASAKMIKVADDMLQQIIGLL